MKKYSIFFIATNMVKVELASKKVFYEKNTAIFRKTPKFVDANRIIIDWIKIMIFF